MISTTRRPASFCVPAALVAVAALVVAACQPSTPPPRETATPAPRSTPSAPPPATAAPAARPAAAKALAPAVALPSMDLPPGAIYMCDAGGKRRAIEFPDGVEKLCRKHPEMGPCQYERDACRHRGGRVYTALGEEVTLAVEAVYDSRVHRVRFQADTAPTKR